jgi:hypothetical protein
MAKYTSDGNLIQGAATAYKNYDNAPGMYAGLDKVIEQGSKIFEEQMEKRRVVEKKFDDASEGVLLRSGALGKTLYGTATEDAKKFRELYIEGINTKDPSKKMEAMVALQNLSDFVQDHKQTNLDVAESRKNKELSSYYEDSPAGRRKAEIMTQIQDQKYSKVSENEEGQKQFHVTVDGEEILVTNKEYKEMASTIRNYTTGNTYMTALEKARELEIFGEDQFRQTVKQKLPRDNDEWDATAYDDVIAGNKNLPKMLNDSQSLDQEIISALGQDAYQKFDTDGKSYYEDKDGNKIQGLSPDEKAAFIDAVVDSENTLFNLKTSNQILIDQLTNAGRNSHTTHWQKINDEKAIKEQKALEKGNEGLNLKRGYVRYDQMAREHKLIGSGNEGDVFQFKYNGNDVTVRRQKDGRWKYNDGTETGMLFTPNQVKQISELHHLDDYEEPEEGYVTTEVKGNGNNVIPELPTPNSETFKWNLSISERGKAVDNWRKEFPDFKFDQPGRRKQIVTITAPNRETLKIKLGAGGGDKVKEAKVFNEFMKKNKKNPETLKGLSQEEIKESVAKGEESKFNVGPDGELLSEGYTMNDLGKVVWVGVGPEPTKK